VEAGNSGNDKRSTQQILKQLIQRLGKLSEGDLVLKVYSAVKLCRSDSLHSECDKIAKRRWHGDVEIE
jgi:hypothetical protein